jgi:uncharacterized surface protein with fasciclin (FAS1) repeats
MVFFDSSLKRNSIRSVLAVVAVISITATTASGCSSNTPKSAGTELKITPGPLPAVAKQIPLASDFSEMLAASSVATSVESSAKFTFFVPTNKAVQDYLTAISTTKAALIADAVKLTAFVGAHVTVGEVTATALLNRTGESLTMVDGLYVVIGKSKDGQVLLSKSEKNKATLIAIDVAATNGLVHLVDHVLVS